MDVEAEMAKVRAKVQTQIDRDCIIAEAKIFGMTPIGYAMGLDARNAANKKIELAQARAKREAAWEAFGAQLREAQDQFVSALEAMARGFNRGHR